MRKEKLLVIAKAYPELSKRYRTYLICTAGLTEEEEWRRIFPVPVDEYFKNTFSKRDWIEYEIRDEKGDHRKESKKIFPDSIKNIGAKEDIEAIRRILRKERTTLEELKEEYKKDKSSIGVIRPILENFELREREINQEKEDFLTFQKTLIPTFRPKILREWPSYQFRCSEGCENGHRIICEDIEATELYRKTTDKYKNDKDKIYEVVKGKLFDWMKTRELYFIMGTHYVYATWLIISLIYPKKDLQKRLTECLIQW